jgi:hypothetical protein
MIPPGMGLAAAIGAAHRFMASLREDDLNQVQRV